MFPGSEGGKVRGTQDSIGQTDVCYYYSVVEYPWINPAIALRIVHTFSQLSTPYLASCHCTAVVDRPAESLRSYAP